MALGLRHNTKTGQLNPSHARLQKDTGVCPNTLKDGLTHLVELQLVARKPGHGPGNSTHYQIGAPRDPIWPDVDNSNRGTPRHEIGAPGGPLTRRTRKGQEGSCSQGGGDAAPLPSLVDSPAWFLFSCLIEYRDGKKRPRLPTGWNRPDFEAPALDPTHNGLVLLPGRSGLLVIDCDNKPGAVGAESLLLRGIDLSASTGPIARTPSAGYHFYFRAPAGLTRTTRANFLPGVDTRGEGGLIFCPPTDIPGYGKYSWVNHPETSPLGDAPADLLALMCEDRQPAPVAMPLLTGSIETLSPKQRTILDRRLRECTTAKDRSKADFSFCCWGISCGLGEDSAWSLCHDVGKFKIEGRKYFDLTFQKAMKTVGGFTSSKGG